MKQLDLPVLTAAMPLRVLTYNIRYAAPHRANNEEPWPVRCPKLATQLQFITSGHADAFLCHQEVLHQQLVDLKAALGSEWSHIGVGREDGKTKGEYSPVFYRNAVWTCVRERTYWLSPTPDQPSRGWDAVLERIVTVGEFEHKRMGVRVVVMSTHFDHVGVQAREESAKLILEIARQWQSGGSQKSDDGSGAAVAQGPKPAAVVVGGDFNSTPEDKGYKTMTAADSGMLDAKSRVPPGKRYGNDLTYTGFGEDKPKRIDFLFVSSESGACVKTYGVLTNRFDDGVYISDHRPVVSDFEVPLLDFQG